MAAPFFQCLLKNLPAIISASSGLFNLWQKVQGSKEDDDKVMKAMKLLRDHQGDIDRFIEDPERQRVLMEGYSILVRLVEEQQQRRAGRDQGFRNYGGNDFVPRRPAYHERDNGYAGKEDYRGEFRGREDYGWRDDSRGRSYCRGDDRGGDYVGEDMRKRNDYRRMDDGDLRRREREDERQRQDNDGKSAKTGGNLSKIKGKLVCDVCTELYDTDYRRPMLLPTCGHTFCRACLREICQRQRLRCPVCRSDPFTDVNSLPTNLPLLSLITEEDEATGGSCEDNGNACHEDSSGRSNNGDSCGDNMTYTQLSFEVQLQLALMLSSEEEGVNQDNSNPFAFLDNIELRNTHDIEDDDLQLALAMSMEEPKVPCRPQPPPVTRVEEQIQQTGYEKEVDNYRRQVEKEREEIRKEKENLEREKEEWKKKMNQDRARKTIADLCLFREDPCNEDEDCCDDESCEEEDDDCKEQESCTEEEECCSDCNMGNDNPYTDTSCYMPEEASNNVNVHEEEKLRKKKKRQEWQRKKEQEQIELAMALSLSLQDQNSST